MYVRALARDIGVALETVAHLTELRRLATGGFSIQQATALDNAVAALEAGRTPALIGINQALAEMTLIRRTITWRGGYATATRRRCWQWSGLDRGPLRVDCDGELVAIAQFGPRDGWSWYGYSAG